MGRLTHPGGVLLGLRQLDPDPGQLGFDLGEPRRRGRFVLARRGQPRPRRLDVLGQVPVAAGEQHLLPAPHLVAQPLEAAGPARLALQRPALLLDLEDDVVEAGQVLLGGVELQLGGAAAGLVLGDPGGFLDQLAAIGRPRAENHPDLALLDDGVGLGAQPGVHQQFVDVAQPAVSAVDEVLALARAIEPAGHLDIAHRLDGIEGQRRAASGVGQMPVVVAGTVAVAVAVAVDGGLWDPGVGARRQRDAAQPQRHLRRPGRLAGVAAAEDDVFHLVAAQALGALLTEHPGERVGDIALAAAVGADDGGDAAVEGQLGAIGKRLESGDFEAIETHGHPRRRGRGGTDPSRG